MARFEPGQWGMQFTFGGLAPLTVAGLRDFGINRLTFTELGFRRVLLVNALVSSAFIAAIGLFRPDTPHALMLVVLLAGGFFRSLQFTSINTLGYADIEPPRMSRATSFASIACASSNSACAAA